MSRRRAQPGFTLLEVLAATVVLSIIAVVVLPVVRVTLEHYAQSVAERAAAERGAFAIDRCVRVLREIPVDAGGEAAIASATPSGVVLDDGSGVQLSGGDLVILEAGGASHVLCPGVDAFTLEFLGADGATPTADPALIERINVTIETGGVELRAAAFIRARIGT